MKNPFSKKAPSQQEAFLRTYLDRIAPGVVKFEVDHYIFGSTYRCVWALREYPASTEAQALLRELGETPTKKTSWTAQTPINCGRRWRRRAICGMWRSWCIKCTVSMSRWSTVPCIWK